MVSQRAQNLMVAGICVGVIGFMGNLPRMFSKHTPNLQDKEGPLTGSQRMRGLNQNNGSIDVGRDHDWDLKTRTWQGRRNNLQDYQPQSDEDDEQK